MFDVQRALTDMAMQVRSCRARDGLTLQQLATRCGVAASTIHKVESQQMVPTVAILLKIARGLGCRPEELVRDGLGESLLADASSGGRGNGTLDSEPYQRGIGAWRIDYAANERIEPLQLDPGQRAILYVERGAGQFASYSQRVQLRTGECIEVEGEQIGFAPDPLDPPTVVLIASPAGRLSRALGTPGASTHPLPASTIAALGT